MAFLVIVGALQFLYVVLVGNFVRIPRPATAPDDEQLYQGQNKWQCVYTLTQLIALQCLPLWLQRNSRPVRPHCITPHSNEPREQGRVCYDFT